MSSLFVHGTGSPDPSNLSNPFPSTTMETIVPSVPSLTSTGSARGPRVVRGIPASIPIVSSNQHAMLVPVHSNTVETSVPASPSGTSQTSIRDARRDRRVEVYWPTAIPNATVAFTLPYSSDTARRRTTPSRTGCNCNLKPVTVTLSIAPQLNKDAQIEGDSLCEICLEDIKDGQNILKSSCCRLLTHRRCLSVWAHTKNQGPLIEGRSSFTCPKCRTKMDLAKFRRQLPPLRSLIDKPWARPSYDIDTTFTPLPQPQENPWDRPAPGPGHLRRRNLLLDLADGGSSSPPRSTVPISTTGWTDRFVSESMSDMPGLSHAISRRSEPASSQAETERLRQNSTTADSRQRYQRERQSPFQMERLWQNFEEYQEETSEDNSQRRLAELQRQAIVRIRTREVRLQREATEVRRQVAELTRQEAQWREREAEENQRQEATKVEYEAALRHRLAAISRERQPERERGEAERRRLQILERIRQREAARQNAH